MTSENDLGPGSEVVDVVAKIVSEKKLTANDYEELKRQLNQLPVSVRQLGNTVRVVADLLEARKNFGRAVGWKDEKIETIFGEYFVEFFIAVDQIIDGENGDGLRDLMPQYSDEYSRPRRDSAPVVQPSREELRELVKMSLNQLIFGMGANGYLPTPGDLVKLIASQFPNLQKLIDTPGPWGKDGIDQKLYPRFPSVVASIFAHKKGLDSRFDPARENWGHIHEGLGETINNARERNWDLTMDYYGRMELNQFRLFHADELDWQSEWAKSKTALSGMLDQLLAKNFSAETKRDLRPVILEVRASLRDASFFDSAEIPGGKRVTQCIRVGLTKQVIELVQADGFRGTPWEVLGLSVFFGQSDLVSEFLDRGAFNDGDDESLLLGRLLLLAVLKNHIDVASLLLDRGASTEEIKYKKKSELSDEFREPSPAIEQARISFPFSLLLINAIHNNSVDMIDLLTEKVPHLRDFVGQEGLATFIAAECKDEKPLVALLRHGADVQAVNKEGENLLHQNIASDVARFLFKSGVDVKATDNDGRTPLHGSTVEVARVLIECGADVDARDHEGNTPLYLAASRGSGDGDLVKTLMDAGSDVNAKNDDGQTALHQIAVRGNHNGYEYFKWLTATLLIEAGADVNAQDNFGFTPLHRAASFRGMTTSTYYGVKFLLENGADSEATTTDGKTAGEFTEDWSSERFEYLASELRKTHDLLVDHQ